jgi:DNA-binding CsgD family transcriptional regulator
MEAVLMQPSAGCSPEVMVRGLALSLDHVGRGMVLLGSEAVVLHANRQAHQALQGAFPLRLHQGRLTATQLGDAELLETALRGAFNRGLRRLVTLGAGAVSVAVLPLGADGAPMALVSLPRAPRTLDLALQAFARQQGLTEAETAVLEGLVAGESPAEIAERKQVRLSTVRTQIGQVRLKTGTTSIRTLVDRVAALPPMIAVLQ